MKQLRPMLRLVHLSAMLIGGRRFWMAVILPLIWPAFQAFRLLVGWRQIAFAEASAQNTLIGLPLIVLAIGLGVRIIAGEMDLSFASIMAIGMVAFILVFEASGNVWLSILAALAVGLFAGLINGAIIVIFGIPSLVATIGTQFFTVTTMTRCRIALFLAYKFHRSFIIHLVFIFKLNNKIILKIK